MRMSLKATTAILASLNLVAPVPAIAQEPEEAPAETATPDCAADPTDPACAPDAAADEAEAASGAGAAAPDAEAEAEADGEAAADATSEPAADAAPAEPAPEGASSDDTGAGSADPDAPARGETVAPAEADLLDGTAEDAAPPPSAGEATGDDTGAASADPNAPAAGETMAPAEADLLDGTSEDAAPPPSADQAPEDDASAEEAPAEDAEMDALEEALREGSDTAPESGAGGAGSDSTDADAAGSAPQADGGSNAGAESGGEGGEIPAPATEGSTAERRAAPAPDDAEAPDAPARDAAADDTAPQPADQRPAPRAAAAAEDAEPVESESVTVTEETSRSSSEDFRTRIDRTEDADASARRAEEDEDDDGLSTLEKGLLLGAGALAVGAVLGNNRQVVAAADDRVVVSRGNGDFELIKDDNAILARPGSQVETETYSDGSSRTIVRYDDGSRVVTIRDADLRVLRRERITPDGESILLVDDLRQEVQPVDVDRLRGTERPSRVVDLTDAAALRAALAHDAEIDRAYSLDQVRSIEPVRAQVPAIDLEAVTFDSGSAAIRPEQAEELRALGDYIRETIAADPRAVFLVEGHTDAVGDAAYNLALSDRRAESVALALGEYFDVPTSNLVVQGYGERFLKVETEDAERANRRATIRDITPLLQTAASR